MFLYMIMNLKYGQTFLKQMCNKPHWYIDYKRRGFFLLSPDPRANLKYNMKKAPKGN